MTAPLPNRGLPPNRPAAGHSPATPLSHDQYSNAIVSSLTRPIRSGCGWGVIRTALWGLLTFGIGPVLVWTFAFRDHMEAERRQLTQLAGWFRFRSIHPESTILRNAAEQLYPRPFLSTLPVILCGAIVLFFMAQLGGNWPGLGRLIGVTYHYPIVDRIDELGWTLLLTTTQSGPLFIAWAAGLTAAYLCHWLQVRSYQASVRRFLGAFERFAVVEGLAPVEVRQPPSIWPARWLIANGPLLFLGAMWAPAATLAGAAQRRYITGFSPAMRTALAKRVHQLIDVRRQATLRPPARCARERCQAHVPPAARFCKRCGMEVISAA